MSLHAGLFLGGYALQQSPASASPAWTRMRLKVVLPVELIFSDGELGLNRWCQPKDNPHIAASGATGLKQKGATQGRRDIHWAANRSITASP